MLPTKTPKKVIALVTTAVFASSFVGCGDRSADTDAANKQRIQDLEGQAQSNEQKAQVQALEQLLGNFREGATPPEGWPGDLIPVPEGAKPVASLQKSVLPNGAETFSMFYASDQAPEDVQWAYRSELPKKGWNEVRDSALEDLALVTAQNGKYNGLFMAGTLPSVPKLQSGEIVNVVVLLTMPGASPAP